MARTKTLSEELAEQASHNIPDYDPEDFENQNLSDSESNSDENSSDEEKDRTEHYVTVGKSRLRDDGIALAEGKYKGSRVSRDDLNQSDSSEESQMDSEDEQEMPKLNTSKPSTGISQILSAEQKYLLTKLTTEQNDDVNKGLAVTAQMKMYEGLLDLRIQSQKILASATKFSSGDEEPTKASSLYPLIGEVLRLRDRLSDNSSEKNSTSATGTTSINEDSFDELVDKCSKQDEALRRKRESVLTKWSKKVALSSGKNAMQTSKLTSLGQSAAVQVNNVLGDIDRLIVRTQTDRSQASEVDSADKTNTESAKSVFFFDDTDFYRLLLKDLIDRRMADSNNGGLTNASGLKWKVSKHKKKVDTKASKGRKLRYNVVEKIQGFDAPRNVYTWNDNQAEDLYAGLLGVHITMDDNEESSKANEDEVDTNIKVGNDFALFG